MSHFVVLMVEDDSATLSLLAAIAKREGFDVLLADDGEKAMSILRQQPVDAMVLDLLLPGTSGLEILRHCRRTLPDLLSRTIVMTAASEQTWSGSEEIRKVRRFYRKPLDFADLTSALHACRAAKARERAGADCADENPLLRSLPSTT
ncbi:MAG TPA: response regulator [Thermoanaerobaculia bacterium]|jgi:DNA-binding response OmpR family regulator|nr:response regulator [Thermoanaerobaculia bacterium]